MPRSRNVEGGGDAPPNEAEEFLKGLGLKVWQEVNVLRSSGEIESGWRILGADPEAQIVRVYQPQPGKEIGIQKDVSATDLKVWNAGGEEGSEK